MWSSCAELCRRSGGRSAGRPPGPCGSRSSGCPRRRRSRSAARARRRGSWASAQSTSSPFIQIFSVSCIAAPPSQGRMVRGLLDDVHRPSRATSRTQLGRAKRGHVPRRAGADPDDACESSVRSIEDARRRARAGTARPRPARSRSPRALRPARAIRRRSRRRRRRSSPRRRAGRPGTSASDRAAVADEDERLDDLRRARSRPPRAASCGGRRPCRELLDPRLGARLAQERARRARRPRARHCVATAAA